MIGSVLTQFLSSAPSALTDHLWQSTLFAAAAALLTLTLRRHSARYRYRLWLAASLKFLVPFSLLIAIGAQFQGLRHTSPQTARTYKVAEVVSHDLMEPSFTRAHFEQSFSIDGGKTWEVNWITDQTRVQETAEKTR